MQGGSMMVVWKDQSDQQRLRDLVAKTLNAKQRDRYRVVLLAGEGSAGHRQLTRDQIAERVGRCRQFVDEWVRRYRKRGMEGLCPIPQRGRPAKLSVAEQEELCQMIDAGPAPEEGIAAYNGPILREKIEKHFNKVYKLDAVYKLLHRLGYNDLMPRPNHPDTDPAVLEAFKKKSSPRSWRRSKPPIRTSLC
jgi:transposase